MMHKKIVTPHVRSAYAAEGDRAPLIATSSRNNASVRSVRSQREQGRLNRAFDRFFTIEGKGRERYNTNYDLHRWSVYASQTSALKSKYREIVGDCSSVLDLGCGTGKLMRRIAYSPAKMAAILAGETHMRMLGVDCNVTALQAATLKMELMFSKNPGMAGNLDMEFIRMDLIDLAQLDLRRTCIGESRVDLELGSDIIYYMRRGERRGLAQAMRKKLRDGGHLVIFEFVEARLTPDFFLGKKQAERLVHLSERERDIEALRKMIEAAGFAYIPEVSENKGQGAQAIFPPMVSMAFRAV